MTKLKVVEHHFLHSRIKNADSKSKPCWQISYQYYLHDEDAHPNRTKDMFILIKPGHNPFITSLKWWKMKIEILRSHFISCAFPLFLPFHPSLALSKMSLTVFHTNSVEFRPQSWEFSIQHRSGTVFSPSTGYQSVKSFTPQHFICEKKYSINKLT